MEVMDWPKKKEKKRKPRNITIISQTESHPLRDDERGYVGQMSHQEHWEQISQLFMGCHACSPSINNPSIKLSGDINPNKLEANCHFPAPNCNDDYFLILLTCCQPRARRFANCELQLTSRQGKQRNQTREVWIRVRRTYPLIAWSWTSNAMLPCKPGILKSTS